MSRARRPAEDVPLDSSLRCEDCDRERACGEPGWIRVRYLPWNQRAAGPEVLLCYCPSHAGQFDPRESGVVRVPVGG